MKDRIADFIKKQRVATVCCIDEKKQPYCFNCYFAYEESEQLIAFKTSPHTYHAANMLINPTVAGTILPDKLSTVHVQGVQFEGEYVMTVSDEITKLASQIFYKKYPFAKAMPGELWIIRLTHMKFTDSTLGIGKKLEWPVLT